MQKVHHKLEPQNDKVIKALEAIKQECYFDVREYITWGRRKYIPAVQAELTEPAETIALEGKTFCLWKTSTRRGTHSSFCSRWPSLNITNIKKNKTKDAHKPWNKTWIETKRHRKVTNCIKDILLYAITFHIHQIPTCVKVKMKIRYLR